MLAHDITRVSWLAVVLAALALAISAHVHGPHAQAQPALELDLRVHAQPECPDASWLAQRIEAQLGRELASGDASSTLHAELRIVREHAVYTLTLRTARATARGERTLAGASCFELAEAAALVLALSLDSPDAPPSPAQGTPGPQGAQGTDSSNPEAAGPSDRSSARARRWAVRAAGSLLAGVLPRSAFGPELALGLSLARSRLELSAMWLPELRSAPARDGAAVDVRLWTARAGYCHDLFGVRLRVGGCTGLSFGQLVARGIGVRQPLSRRESWSAAWVALRLSLPVVAPLSLVAEPALVLPLVRRRFVSSDANGARVATLHEPAKVAFRATLGIELSF